MARKGEGNNTAGTASTARSLEKLKSLRSQIDKLDLQIVKLINERAALAAEIGKAKADQGEEIFSAAREEEVFQNVLQASKGPLTAVTIRAVFREIMSGARALQKVLKVAYLGPEYSFSHLAGVERFGQTVEFVAVSSIAAVFEEVDRGHVDFGVVPVENSYDGRIADTLDMFLQFPHLPISAEIRLQVHHNLVATCEPQEIRRIYSKPQALAQCRAWLAKNMPNAKLKDVSSTATAAELAQQEEGAAAVASRQAAVRYGLRILFESIEDSPHNETRFAVIGHHKAAKTGHDKTSIVFRVPHNPGSLYDCLELFKQNKINLTMLESFPARSARPDKPEYIFFVDCEGHQDDPRVAKALKGLGEHCLQVLVLGSFPMAPLLG